MHFLRTENIYCVKRFNTVLKECKEDDSKAIGSNNCRKINSCWCQTATVKPSQDKPVQEQQVFANVLEVTTELTEYSVYTQTIKATIKNPTDEDAFYGAFFELQKLDSGKWEKVPYKEDGDSFIELGYGILANTEEAWTFDLKSHYDLPLAEGVYRFVFSAWSNSPTLTNEFEVVKGGEPPVSTEPLKPVQPFATTILN
jgi:hypothetical protein